MRVDGGVFQEANVGRSKEPRYVIQVAFDTDSTDLYYFTSHADAALPAGAVSTASVISGISGTSQKINPDKARSEIGAISINLLDHNSAITALLASKLTGGDGLRDKRVRVYIGHKGHVWDDYIPIQTQIVRRLSFKNGLYTISCSDVQRTMRKDIFEIKEASLSSTVNIGDTTINVVSTTGFSMVSHGTSYSDSPSVKVGYIKIDDEIISYTGITATTFTGCTRAVLNTKEETHEFDSGANNVEEYVYLEMPALKLAYALLTGVLYGQGGETLPDNWHLGITSEYINVDGFLNHSDIWDSTDDALGVILRFEGLDKQSAKRFIEEQVLFLVGCFMPINSLGELGIYKMSRVLGDAPFVARLNESNIVSHGSLIHDKDSTINQIKVQWNWNELDGKYTRTNLLLDAESINTHGLSDQREIKARGLHGSIHTDAVLSTLFDFVRDRYAGPPQRITVNCLPSFNRLEVGDIVRLNVGSIRDSVDGGVINRSFEVQNIKVDWITGNVSLRLFGSTQLSSEISLPDDASVLPSGFYTAKGTAINTNPNTVVVTGNNVTAGGTLAGDADMNAAGAVWYHDGDLTIDAGVKLMITNNTQLRVNGTLTVNGTITGAGQGLAGGVGATSIIKHPDVIEYYQSPDTSGTAGFLGNTAAQHGVLNFPDPELWTSITWVRDIPATVGLLWGTHTTIPKINAVYDTSSGDLKGLPSDMRGTSGSGGGPAATTNGSFQPWTYGAAGGNGGASGGGLVIVCKSLAKGGSGEIILDGADGSVGGSVVYEGETYYGGAGAGGSPGAFLLVLDGSGAIYPDMNGLFSAAYGSTPLRGVFGTTPGWTAAKETTYRSGGFHFYLPPYYANGTPAIPANHDSSAETPVYAVDITNTSSYRVHYVPDYTAAEEDTSLEVVDPPANLTLASGDSHLIRGNDGTIVSRIYAAWDASPYPFIKGYRVEYKKSADSDWVAISSLTAKDTTRQYISPVEDGVQYDVRVQAISKYNKESAWLYKYNEAVVGKLAPPPDMTGLSVSQSGGGPVVIKCDELTHATLPDFAGNVYRYGPQIDALGWNDATPINTKPDTDNITDGSLPPGSHRIFGKRQDTSALQSVNAVYVDITITTDFDAIEDNEQAPAWPGTLTNFVTSVYGKLVPDSTKAANLHTNAELFEQFVPYPQAQCVYESPIYDLAFDTIARVWGNIQSHLGPNKTGVANPKLQIKYRTDAGAWTDWADWAAADVEMRYVQFRLVLDSSIGVAIIDAMRCVADLKEWTQKITGVAVVAGNNPIVFPLPYHVPPFLRVWPVGDAALSVTYDANTLTATGVTLIASGNGVCNYETEGV